MTESIRIPTLSSIEETEPNQWVFTLPISEDLTYFPGMTNGKMKAYGVEIMIRKDKMKGRNGLFGWTSYTFTRSLEKTGLPTEDGLHGYYFHLEDPDNPGTYDRIPFNYAGDPWGDHWIRSAQEQIHTLKLVAGYQYNKHIFSCRFQYFTTFPVPRCLCFPTASI